MRCSAPSCASTGCGHREGVVAEGDRLTFGPFDLEFVAVNHSIPDALAVAIRTGAGMVLHTGDFKMDQLPLDGRITDLRAFARLGEEGVDLFMVDSTNAEVPGSRPRRSDITPVIDQVFRTQQQRIIVACFASHVHRVQQVLDAAAEHGRKVAYVGRSMVRNMGIAADLGYLDVPPGLLVDAKALADLPPETGRADLHRLPGRADVGAEPDRATQPPLVHIEQGDTVVLASSLIPGNENAVYRVINGLARRGADVVHKGNALVHVTGHASAGELLYCYNLVQPRNVLPVHGEIRHLRANAALAAADRHPAERVVLAEDGVVVDLVDGVARSPARSTAATSSSTAARWATSRRRAQGPPDPGRGGVHLGDRRGRLPDRQGGQRPGDPRPRVRRGRRPPSASITGPIVAALDGPSPRAYDSYQLQQIIRRVVGRWVSGGPPPAPDDRPGRPRGLNLGDAAAPRDAGWRARLVRRSANEIGHSS